jgi:hypothetical protein
MDTEPPIDELPLAPPDTKIVLPPPWVLLPPTTLTAPASTDSELPLPTRTSPDEPSPLEPLVISIEPL